MFQRKQRRFRSRQNGRNHLSHGNGYKSARPRSNSFSNNQVRNNFRTTQSAEKLFEKYSSLAKEAMSVGDKTLCENYLQHADHFMRIIEDKNKNREQVKANEVNKPIIENKLPPENSEVKQQDENKN
ncbi:MAG: DUF4167 domain-containing protein [Candidatus Pelagibacterales bacterium]|nr:MAG: DUF4167 domain-containing protein [Pelagibacterales bacterium]